MVGRPRRRLAGSVKGDGTVARRGDCRRVVPPVCRGLTFDRKPLSVIELGTQTRVLALCASGVGAARYFFLRRASCGASGEVGSVGNGDGS